MYATTCRPILGLNLFCANVQRRRYDLNGDLSSASEAVKTQIARAIGANISTCYNMYSAKEILYRHAVHELGFYEWDSKESGDIDNAELFLSEMVNLEEEEMKVVLEVLVLCMVLDGKVSRRERKLYERAVQACQDTEQGKGFKVHDGRVLELAQTYRNMKSLTKEAVQVSASPPTN